MLAGRRSLNCFIWEYHIKGTTSAVCGTGLLANRIYINGNYDQIIVLELESNYWMTFSPVVFIFDILFYIYVYRRKCNAEFNMLI